MKISVIVTNFNALKTLEQSLPLIIEHTPQADEFIFVDDASSDGSVEFVRQLQKKNKKIKIIVLPKNSGFLVASNTAFKAATGELIVMLNNDIFPKANYLEASLKHFKDPTVFGVSFAEEGHEHWARFFWADGYLQHEPGVNDGTTHITAWVSGGSSVVRKEYLDKLEGFDPAYVPAYFEDMDLGYRAWKSGYKLLFEPQSIVVHNHGTSYNKLPRHFINYVKERNHLLSVLRNITDKKLLTDNRWAQFGRVLFGPNYIKIIRAAHRQLHQCPPPIVFPVLSDEEIFNLFK